MPSLTSKKSKSVPKESSQEIRIKLRGYDHKVLDVCSKQIIDTVLRQGAKVAGPIPLPTEIKRYTVNRSTFVHKDSREQFETRIHKRLIIIFNPSPQIIEALSTLNLAGGIDIEIKS